MTKEIVTEYLVTDQLVSERTGYVPSCADVRKNEVVDTAPQSFSSPAPETPEDHNC